MYNGAHIVFQKKNQKELKTDKWEKTIGEYEPTLFLTTHSDVNRMISILEIRSKLI